MKTPMRWRDRPDAPKRLRRMLDALDGEPGPGARERSWRRIDEALSRKQRHTVARRGLAFAGAAAAVALAAWIAAPRVAPQPALPRAESPAPRDVQVAVEKGEVKRYAVRGAALAFTGPARAIVADREGRPFVQLEVGTVEVSRDGSLDWAIAVVAAAAFRVEGTSFTATFSAERELTVRAGAEAATVHTPEGAVLVRAGAEWPDRAAAASAEAQSEPTPLVAAFSPVPKVTAPPSASRTPNPPQSPVPSVEPPPLAPEMASPAPPALPTPAVRGAAGGIAAEAAAAAPTAAERWAQANALVRAGRFAEALWSFEALSTDPSAGPFSELAQYEEGRLRARHLSDPAGAAAAFRAYAQRFPSGTLALEAEAGLIESLAASGDTAEALGRIATALGSADRGRTAELRFLRGQVLRERGELARALEDFAEVSREPGARGEEATIWAAWCEQKLGRADAARERLQTYLKAHPSGAFREQALQALGRR